MNRVYKDGSALAVDSNHLMWKMPEVTSQSEKTQNFQSDNQFAVSFIGAGFIKSYVQNLKFYIIFLIEIISTTKYQ